MFKRYQSVCDVQLVSLIHCYGQVHVHHRAVPLQPTSFISPPRVVPVLKLLPCFPLHACLLLSAPGTLRKELFPACLLSGGLTVSLCRLWEKLLTFPMDAFSGLRDRMGLWVPRMLGTSSFKIIAQKMKEVKRGYWIDLFELEGLLVSARIAFY